MNSITKSPVEEIKNPTILIVDDNPNNLQIISDCLKDSGCRILAARDGISALEKAQFAQPDLILMDVLMGGIDGFETCRRLKKNKEIMDIPVIFMTALNDTQSKLQGFQSGGVDYIFKPFQPDEVLARIQIHLKLQEQNKRLQEQARVLASTNNQLRNEIAVREMVEQALQKTRDELEKRVEERTFELENVVNELRTEIVDRIQAEKALKESEERFRALFDDNPSMYFILNSQGTVLSVNKFGASYLGYETKELIGNSLLEISYPDDRKVEQQNLQNCVRNPMQLLRWELRRVRKDGGILWVRESIRALAGASSILLLLVVCEDITDRKLAEEALQKANDLLEIKVEERTEELNALNEELVAMNEELQGSNEELNSEIKERSRVERELAEANGTLTTTINELKIMQTHLVQSEKMAALGNLVAGMAHEINTPIGVGVTAASYLNEVTECFISLCKAGTPDSGDMLNYLEDLLESSAIILKNLERAGRLIQSFKLVSVDQSSDTYRMFNIKSYLQEILLSIRPKLKKSHLSIAIECDDSLDMEGHPGAFSQIISNLLLNSQMHAFKETEDGKIQIKVYKEENKISLVFSDDGCGMEYNVLARIYDPFFTTARSNGGSGLGLYVVYNLVTQQFGGEIDCSSEPGKGTTFKIQIPLKKEV